MEVSSAGCCNKILFNRWVAKGGNDDHCSSIKKLNSFDDLNSGFIKPNPLPKNLSACVFETSVQIKPVFGQVPLEEIIFESYSIFYI